MCLCRLRSVHRCEEGQWRGRKDKPEKKGERVTYLWESVPTTYMLGGKHVQARARSDEAGGTASRRVAEGRSCLTLECAWDHLGLVRTQTEDGPLSDCILAALNNGRTAPSSPCCPCQDAFMCASAGAQHRGIASHRKAQRSTAQHSMSAPVCLRQCQPLICLTAATMPCLPFPK